MQKKKWVALGALLTALALVANARPGSGVEHTDRTDSPRDGGPAPRGGPNGTLAQLHGTLNYAAGKGWDGPTGMGTPVGLGPTLSPTSPDPNPIRLR